MLTNVVQFDNPYPLYKKQRELSPVFQDDQGTWFLTRYDDVKLLLTDNRFSRRPPGKHGFVNQQATKTALDKVISDWAVLNDPPRHTQLRKTLDTIVNPSFIKTIRGTVETIADSLTISIMQSSQVDFVHAFAIPLPVKVINILTGSTLDIATTRKWANCLSTALDHGSPQDFQAITQDIFDMIGYFKQIIISREKMNPNDWIGELISLKNTNQLTLDDVISTCIFLMLAGHETLQLSIGLGMMTLLRNPSQIQLLQDNPQLVTSAVEEILRFEAPLSKLSRWTQEEVEFQGIIIPKNQLVVGMVNAANRDPEKYPNPDQFDITRKNIRHLTFGQGIHNCLGALLARIELHIGLAKLIPHMHKFTLIEDQIEWQPNSSFRYLHKLMIKVDS